jgi:hypothetical protein
MDAGPSMCPFSPWRLFTEKRGKEIEKERDMTLI